jgi:hypothetical protein
VKNFNIRRFLAVALVICLAGCGISLFNFHPTHAQIGAAPVPGFYAFGSSAFPPALTAGQAGTVTNTSGLNIQIDGGPVFCFGNQSNISESTITLAANTTFMVVYNCPQDSLYAKTAVTGPGSLGTNALNGPGVPAQILAPIYGIEVPIATVVCGASTCATITDQRPVSVFPAGAQQAGSVTFANLPATYPNGAMIYCSTCTLPAAPATCVGAGTGSIAFRINGAWVCP